MTARLRGNLKAYHALQATILFSLKPVAWTSLDMLADELPRWPWGAPGVGGGGGEREAACADPPVPDPVGWDCPACGPCALPERCWFEWIAGRGGNSVGVGGGGRRACAC
jgi:hypothetical protein